MKILSMVLALSLFSTLAFATVPPTLDLKNQFGEVSKNYVIGGNAVVSAAIGQLLTGYVAGTQGSVSPLSASDSILVGLEKLDGNKPSYVESTFTATFDHSIGAKTVVVRKIGKLVTIEIPLGSTADGAGTVIASGATDIPAADRPAADLYIMCAVTDNAAGVFGIMKVSAAGQISFGSGAGFAGFTGSAAAGFNREAATFTVP